MRGTVVKSPNGSGRTVREALLWAAAIGLVLATVILWASYLAGVA